MDGSTKYFSEYQNNCGNISGIFDKLPQCGYSLTPYLVRNYCTGILMSYKSIRIRIIRKFQIENPIYRLILWKYFEFYKKWEEYGGPPPMILESLVSIFRTVEFNNNSLLAEPAKFSNLSLFPVKVKLRKWIDDLVCSCWCIFRSQFVNGDGSLKSVRSFRLGKCTLEIHEIKPGIQLNSTLELWVMQVTTFWL